MKKKILSPAFLLIKDNGLVALIAFVFLLASCQKETGTIPQQEKSSAATITNRNAEKQSKKIYVSNVDELYMQINDPNNAGATLVLAPGTYSLNANHPKAGRLELGYDMSLIGQPGNAGKVIIDATNLPASSFTIPASPGLPAPLPTGVIRMGNGKNSLEWMTLQNDPLHVIRSFVQTDIVATPIAEIRIAHAIINGGGCNIGMSVGNFGATANGRMIEAEIEDNEIMNNINPSPTGKYET